MSHRNRTHRAREALITMGQRYPRAWDLANELRNGGPGLTWPNWCYLPMGGWYAIVADLHARGSRITDLSAIGDVSRLAALGTWRMTQGIYRFDPALYPALVDTPVTGDIPSQMLYRLPEWCVYLETPDLEWHGQPLHGVWAHLEHDHNTGRPELRLLTDSDAGMLPIVMHLGDWTLDEAITRAAEESRRHATGALRAVADRLQDVDISGHLRPVLEPITSLLLYVCSEADFSRRGQPCLPSNPEPTRTRRHGYKLFAASGPTEWDVGVRLGAALRAAYHAQETDRASGRDGPRPHIRRAHWHTFVSGRRLDDEGQPIPADRRRRELRWMPPIAVNLDDASALPAVVRPVK